MRRPLIALLAILVPAAIFGLLTYKSYEPGLPRSAQGTLMDYIQIKNTVFHAPIIVQQIRHATRPDNFISQMSVASYGDGIYFNTTYQFGSYASNHPLPYPPQDLWCAVATGKQGQEKVILIALHEDLYIAGWTIHEIESDSASTSTILKDVGCESNLTQ
jgi:hypothetical protein